MSELRSILLTKSAHQQLELILENDFTLVDKVLRITIDGKGCDGFGYAIGFTEKFPEDLIIHTDGFNFHLDPFIAKYFYEGSIDYQQNFDDEIEGFVVVNLTQDKTKGKFWLKQDK